MHQFGFSIRGYKTIEKQNKQIKTFQVVLLTRPSVAGRGVCVIIIIIISLFKEDNILSNTITYLTYGPL